MEKWQYSMYLGSESDDVFIDFLSHEKLFVIVTLESQEGKALDKEIVRTALSDLHDAVEQFDISNLDSFIRMLDQRLDHLQNHGELSYSAILNVKDVVYASVKGKGVLYVGRDGVFQKLIDGDNTSSGYLKNKDYFLLTTKDFVQAIQLQVVNDLIENNPPQNIVESITPELKAGNDLGIIGLFMQCTVISSDDENAEEYVDDDIVAPAAQKAPVAAMSYQPPTHAVVMPDMHMPAQHPREKSVSLKNRMAGLFGKNTQVGKMITIGVIILLSGVLVWSVVLGNNRRIKKQYLETVSAQSVVISEKLDSAETASGTNIQKALGLIDESKAILKDLRQKADDLKLENVEQLSLLEDQIAEAEKSIKKEETGTAEDFYDVALISTSATARKMYTDGENIALLDTKNGAVYVVSAEDKSVETFKDGSVKKAEFVALHNDIPYVYGKEIGVVKIDPEKPKEQIPPDPDLGTVKDFWMFNGNIYLLDATNDEVYKYLVAEEGYSDKKSYITSGKADFSEATAMAIDAAVYVSAGDSIFKYVSGVKDSFSVSIPDNADVTFEDIFASESTNRVYALDVDSGRVFTFDKDGDFVEQMSLSILQNADDIIAIDGVGIIVLSDGKLYSAKTK